MQITIGTRKSKWAMAATHVFADILQQHANTLNIDILPLDTPGDLKQNSDLMKDDGLKSFVDAISMDVASKKIDVAIHTIKDISWPIDPTNFPQATLTENGLTTSKGLLISAVGKRNDPRDALVFREGENLDTLRSQPTIRVGTSSIARAGFFKQMYPDSKFDTISIRGNIDVRLDKLDRGEYDILILSMDGLLAVEQQHRATIIFELDQLLPALGQGIGAAEVRADNQQTVSLLNTANDSDTMNCLRAEWSLLKYLNANARTPIVGICQQYLQTGALKLKAKMIDYNGNTISSSFSQTTSQTPEELGIKVAEDLITKGAHEITQSWEDKDPGLSQDAC